MSEMWWRHLSGIFWIWISLLLVLIPIYYFLPNYLHLDAEMTDYANFVSILAMLVGLLGFSSAFIGSLSIQYSLTKILLRYKYIQILAITFLIIIAKYFLTKPIVDYLQLTDVGILFNALLIITLIFIFIHTFLLIDKMFDPEELIAEVIGDQILNAELVLLKREKSSSHTLFTIFKDKCYKSGEEMPLIPNEALYNILIIKPELDSFYKAVERLATAGSLRIVYLLDYIHNYFYFRKGYRAKNKHIDLVKKELCRVDGLVICPEGYSWFIRASIILAIYSLVKNDKKYDIIFSSLLVYLVVVLRDKGPEFNPKRLHGDLNMVGFLSMVVELRDKRNFLDILKITFADKKGSFHKNIQSQVKDLTKYLICDFLDKNQNFLLKNERMSPTDGDNLYRLVELSNTILKDSRDKSRNDFLKFFTELMPYLISYNETKIGPFLGSESMSILNAYFNNLFELCWGDAKNVLEAIARGDGLIKRKEYLNAFASKLNIKFVERNEWNSKIDEIRDFFKK